MHTKQMLASHLTNAHTFSHTDTLMHSKQNANAPTRTSTSMQKPRAKRLGASRTWAPGRPHQSRRRARRPDVGQWRSDGQELGQGMRRKVHGRLHRKSIAPPPSMTTKVSPSTLKGFPGHKVFDVCLDLLESLNPRCTDRRAYRWVLRWRRVPPFWG